MMSLVRTIISSHDPTWQNMNQLLSILLEPEDRARVFIMAEKAAREMIVQHQVLNPEQALRDVFPRQEPQWDPYCNGNKKALRHYRDSLVTGMECAGRKATNLAKVATVTQDPRESLMAYLERLKEAYRLYTPVNPDDPDMACTIIMSFVQQAAPDIKKKLQKVEAFETQTLSYLLELAQKVYVNRDEEAKKELTLKREQKAKLLATALIQGRPQATGSDHQCMNKNQCLRCWQIGHWQASCPQLQCLQCGQTGHKSTSCPQFHGGHTGPPQYQGRGRGRSPRGRVLQGQYHQMCPQCQLGSQHPQQQFLGQADMTFHE